VDPDPGFTMTKNLVFTAATKSYFFSPQIAITLSLGPYEGRPNYQDKPSALKREHPALPDMEFIHFKT
jgi:hypothetical protein